MLINGNMILGSTILSRTGINANITYDLTNCIIDNEIARIPVNSTYNAKITATTTFTYCGAQITMGNKDITLDCYNIATGVINIPKVTGNITIKAEALYTFSNASWYAIKNVAQNNFASTVGWNIGDLKELVIGDYTYTTRICDLTEHRYQYYNNTERYSNMVIECVELLPDSQPRHTANDGNYDTNSIRQYYNETIIPLFPVEISSLLEIVKIPTYWYNNMKGSSNNKIFMPGTTALSGDTYEEETVYQLYDQQTVSARIKHKINNNSPVDWWIRTGSYDNSSSSQEYYSGPTGTRVYSSGGFSPFEGNDDSRRLTKSYAIPIFWAW